MNEEEDIPLNIDDKGILVISNLELDESGNMDKLRKIFDGYNQV